MYTRKELMSLLEYSAKSLGASDQEIFEFTRCVRPNGTAYGTSGKCRKGTEKEAPPLTPAAKTLDSLLKWGVKNAPDAMTKEQKAALERVTPRERAEALNEISKDKTFWRELYVSVANGFINGLVRGL